MWRTDSVITSRILRVLLATFAAAILAACLDPEMRTPPLTPEPDDTIAVGDTSRPDTSSSLTFAVASDLHYLSPRLIASRESPALAFFLAGDRKMILQGPALLHSFLDSLRAAKPDFLLVTGDLTKDGELASHEDMADSLQTLVDAGIRVFVVPGNHDVGMYGTSAYTANGSTTTQTVSAASFARLYRSCGYGKALSRDSLSLSYVAEISKGLRLVALDACAYRDNAQGSASRSCGTLQQGTLDWLWKQLDLAHKAGADVVGAIHYGMLEHFEGQSTESISFGYILSDNLSIARKMAEKGLHAIFTGHFHASDIVSAQVGSSLFTDIETGSLVTPPCRFRTGTVSDGILSLHGHRINEIDYDLGDTSFVDYADRYLFRALVPSARSHLVEAGLSLDEASSLAPMTARAWMSHYAGNETDATPDSTRARIAAWSASDTAARRNAARLLRILSTDLPPDDLETSISLR